MKLPVTFCFAAAIMAVTVAPATFDQIQLRREASGKLGEGRRMNPVVSRLLSSSSLTSKTSKSAHSRSESSSKSEKTSSKDSHSCKDVDDDTPKSVRNGDKYVFELYKKNAKCVDKDGKLYEYGQFNNVKEFSDCADACVKDVRSSTLDSLQGYDWDCDNRKCRCLYDKGTLDNRNSGEYDKTNKENRGKGSVQGTTKKDDYFCANLEKVN